VRAWPQFQRTERPRVTVGAWPEPLLLVLGWVSLLLSQRAWLLLLSRDRPLRTQAASCLQPGARWAPWHLRLRA